MYTIHMYFTSDIVFCAQYYSLDVNYCTQYYSFDVNINTQYFISDVFCALTPVITKFYFEVFVYVYLCSH